MGWDAVLFGELEFPKGGVEAWKALVVEEGLYADKAWKQSAMMGDPVEATTVAGVLAKLEDHRRWCEEKYPGPDHQRVQIEGDRVSLRAYINEDDFRYWCGNIATMVRVADKVGATGEYVALANDEMAGERLVLTGGKSRCEPIDLREMMGGGDAPESDLDYAAIVEEIFATTSEKLERLAEKRGAPAKAAAPKARTAPAKKPAKKTAAKPAKKAK
jgi:hypothetical protein